MEHFHSDWTFKPMTMIHLNAASDIGFLRSIFSHRGQLRDSTLQLLQKIQTLTDAPEGKTMFKTNKEPGVNTFEKNEDV